MLIEMHGYMELKKINIHYIPLLGGCYGKSCKLKGQHTRARNHSAISPCGYCTPQVIAPGPGLMIFITALSKCNPYTCINTLKHLPLALGMLRFIIPRGGTCFN